MRDKVRGMIRIPDPDGPCLAPGRSLGASGAVTVHWRKLAAPEALNETTIDETIYRRRQQRALRWIYFEVEG